MKHSFSWFRCAEVWPCMNTEPNSTVTNTTCLRPEATFSCSLYYLPFLPRVIVVNKMWKTDEGSSPQQVFLCATCITTPSPRDLRPYLLDHLSRPLKDHPHYWWAESTTLHSLLSLLGLIPVSLSCRTAGRKRERRTRCQTPGREGRDRVRKDAGDRWVKPGPSYDL